MDHAVICHDVGLNHMGIIHAHTMPTVDLDLVPSTVDTAVVLPTMSAAMTLPGTT